MRYGRGGIREEHPWVALGYVAAATDRVRLGTVVSQIALRDPVLMARELITLDILSRGRTIVGAGAGWVEAEFLATNVNFDTRGGRLNEFLRVLRRLFTEPEKGWAGKYFNVPPSGIVKPATPGGPPIWVGAANEAGLKRVARYGDGLLTATLPFETVVKTRDRVLALRAEMDKSGPFPVYAQINIPETLESARATAVRYHQAGIDGVILSEPLARTHGLPSDDVSEALLAIAHA